MRDARRARRSLPVRSNFIAMLKRKIHFVARSFAHGPASRSNARRARGRRQGQRAARLAARARSDRADRRQSAAHPCSTRHRGDRAEPRRRPCADLGARHADLSRACRTRQSLCALGARSKSRQRRDRLPDDAEPAGIYGDLARHHQRRRRRVARSTRNCAARRWRIASTSSRRSMSSSPRNCATQFRSAELFNPAENLVARRPRLAAHRSRDRTFLAGAADGTRSAAR